MLNRIILKIILLITLTQNVAAQKDTVFELLKQLDSEKKCETLIFYAKKVNRFDNKKSIELAEIASGLSKKLKNDTLFIKAQLLLADLYYWELGHYPLVKTVLYSLEGRYFQKMSNRQKCFYYSLLGDAIYYDNEFVLSMQNYYKALEYVGSDSVMMSRLCHNMGWVYADLGKADKAVYYGKRALDIAKKINYNVGHKLEGLMYIYTTLRQYDKALIYLEEAEKISKNSSYYYSYRKAGLYDSKGDLNKAIIYAHEGYESAKLLGNVKFEVSNLHNYIYYNIRINNISEAIKTLPVFEALTDSLKREDECAFIYSILGDSYLAKNNLDSAKMFLHKALLLQKENDLPEIAATFRSLSELYDRKGDLSTSREYLLNYISYKDSLDVIDSVAAVKTKNDQLHMYELENDLNLKNAEMQKNAMQLSKEKTQKYAFLAGLVVVFLFSIVVYRNLISRKKINAALTYQKEKLSHANEELQQQNEEIATQRDQIEKQKEMVEEHQKEIIDSIHYAKRIQTALLPSVNFLRKNLPDHFVLYKPKDIVSGDFYWALRKEENLFVAVADCTGHGVPGAFMSMMGVNLLNEIVLERKVSNPALILDILREEIIRNLNPEGGEEAQDGMDMVLVKFNFSADILEYAAANNSFYLVRDNEITVQLADKMPVGKYHDKVESFTKRTLPLKNGDSVYLITDGYADQFGGSKGKKLKYKPLEEMLRSNAAIPMQEQRKVLESHFEAWKGRLDQVDDVTIIGIRV